MNPLRTTAWNATLTMVLWVFTLAVGVLGFSLPYERPQPPPSRPELPPVELLEVTLADDPVPVPELSAPPAQLPEPPPLIDPVIPPDTPSLPVVAELTEAVAFALPVEGPVRVVNVKEAAQVAPPVDRPVQPAPAPPVRSLVFGAGEGRQPKPEYPYQAKRERQEGSVTVTFSVGPDGRVIETLVSKPCPWTLLNKEAERVIKSRWRFAPGPIRRYEVTIRFELNR